MYRQAYNINMVISGELGRVIQVRPDQVLSLAYGRSVQLYWMAFLFYLFQLDTLLPCFTNILLFLCCGMSFARHAHEYRFV